VTRKSSEIVTTYKQPEPDKPRPIVESVTIPLLISLVTGLLLTGFAVLGVSVIWEVWWPWTWAAFMFLGVTLGTWILQNWDVLLWEAEERSGVDLDRDGVIGDPSQRYVLVNAAPPDEVDRPVDRAHRRMCQFVRDAEQRARRPVTWRKRVIHAMKSRCSESYLSVVSGPCGAILPISGTAGG